MQKRAEQTRRAIVRATAELIGDGGLNEAGLVNICRSAGVSRGALYHHFPTKEAVAAAVHDEARRETTALLDEAFTAALAEPPGTAAATVLTRFGAALGQALLEEPTVRAGLQLDPDGSADHERALRQDVLTTVHRRVSALFPAAPQGGSRPTRQDLADLAMAVLAGLESLGHADATWWSPATSDRIWRTLRPLLTEPTTAPRDSSAPAD